MNRASALILALAGLTIWPAILALGDLSQARADLAAARARESMAPIVQAEAIAGSSTRRSAALAARVRAMARRAGVLVEGLEAAPVAGAPQVRLRLSGPEKAIITLVDQLESDRPLLRLSAWQVRADVDGRVTLDAVVMAPPQ